eukprot:1393041-Amorphochlora_amoeboformis.AAC.1
MPKRQAASSLDLKGGRPKRHILASSNLDPYGLSGDAKRRSVSRLGDFYSDLESYFINVLHATPEEPIKRPKRAPVHLSPRRNARTRIRKMMYLYKKRIIAVKE